MIAKKTHLPEKIYSLPTAPKFIRRQDLTLEIRSALAIETYQSQQGSVWGAITQLSQLNGVFAAIFLDNKHRVIKAEMRGLLI